MENDGVILLYFYIKYIIKLYVYFLVSGALEKIYHHYYEIII